VCGAAFPQVATERCAPSYRLSFEHDGQHTGRHPHPRLSPRRATIGVASWRLRHRRVIITERRWRVDLLRSVRTGVLLLTVLAGCADTPAPGPRTEAPAPTVARVQCGEDGSIDVLTPTVQAQPDGVHIEVEVPAGSNVGFAVRNCCGFNAEDGSFVVPVPQDRCRSAA
jgi:hypothetical protein